MTFSKLQTANAIYAEAQHRFVSYYVGLAEKQQADQVAQGEELPNLVASLKACREHHWWRELGLILLTVGGVLVDQGFWEQYREWLEAALQSPEIVRSQADRELYLELLDSYATAISSHGHPERALTVYRQIIDLAQQSQKLDDVLANAYYGLGTTLFICRRSDEARSAWREAVAVAHRIGDQTIPATVEYFLTEGQSDADILRSLPKASAGPLAKLSGWRHYAEGQLRASRLVRAERYAEAQVAYQQLVVQAEELNELHGLAIALFHLGQIAALTGKEEDALQLLHRSEKIAAQMNDHVGLALIYSSLGLIHLKRNRFDLGRPYLEESVRLEREYGETSALAEDLYWLGYALANTGDLERGQTCFQEAKTLFAKTDQTRVEDVENAISRLRAVIGASTL